MQLVMELDLKETFKLLDGCSAASTEDGILMYPMVAEITGNGEQIFARFAYEAEDGEEYMVECPEKNNKIVIVSGNIMTLHDSEGEEFTIYLLANMDCLKHLQS
jgi:hypothetical protein